MKISGCPGAPITDGLKGFVQGQCFFLREPSEKFVGGGFTREVRDERGVEGKINRMVV